MGPQQETFARWLIWRSAWLLIRWTLCVVLRVEVVGRERIPVRGGAMLLANHTTFWDFLLVFWGIYRTARAIGSEQVFRLPVLGRMLVGLGGIPFSKGAKDGEAVRRLVAAYEQDSIIGMFPEGERSWTGRPVQIKRGTGRLVKSLGCPVIYCRITTGFLQHPRWATWPRWIAWRMEYSEPEVFPPEATADDINAAIARGLAIDPDTVELKGRSWGFRLAEGLPNFLWACPACFAAEALEVGADRDCVVCTDCARRWRVGLRSELTAETPDTEDLTVARAHDRLVAHFPRSEALSCEVMDVTTVWRGHIRQEPVASGAGRLTERGVEVLRGDEVIWSLPYEDMHVALLQFRNALQVRVEGANIQLDPRGQSRLRWHHFLSLRLEAHRASR